jgi:hypothetical protein
MQPFYFKRYFIKMTKFIQSIHPAIFVLIATIFEVSGDAIIRKCIYNYTGTTRVIFFIVGAMLVFCYGFSLNLASVEFGQVVGLYITTLFIVWQIGNYIAFGSLPSLPIIIGGALIITGGVIITFWKSQ